MVAFIRFSLVAVFAEALKVDPKNHQVRTQREQYIRKLAVRTKASRKEQWEKEKEDALAAIRTKLQAYESRAPGLRRHVDILLAKWDHKHETKKEMLVAICKQ